MACNEMFGNFKEGHGSEVDMDKFFTFERCEVGLFNRTAWDLMFDFESLMDAATVLEKS